MGSFCCNRDSKIVFPTGNLVSRVPSHRQVGGSAPPAPWSLPYVTAGGREGGRRVACAHPFLSHSWNQSQGHTSLQGASGNEVIHCCVSTKISGGVSITQRKQGRRAVCLCHSLPHRPPWGPHQAMLSYCFQPRARVSVCGLLPAPGPLHVATV